MIRGDVTRFGAAMAAACAFAAGASDGAPSDADAAYFRTAVEPILVQRCYDCHSHQGAIKGGLALDSPTGLVQGGVGGTILVPGDPDASRLIRAVEYFDKDLRMPPDAPLAPEEVAVLKEWVSRGAPDPRAPLAVAAPDTAEADRWEETYQQRLRWWSLQPLAMQEAPQVARTDWPRTGIDRFLLAALEAKGLAPAPEADPRALVRRLSFALTGLPPDSETAERFAADPSDAAYEALVDAYLASPHYGERWARHWMDVVHYADSHGYEWDAPAKNAWAYRDYLIRAYNADLPFDRLIVEQIAGDLVEPRVNGELGVNEALIGPKSMRLGERRHGDNADAEGVTQEAMANIIDTVSKGFLATTVACAQCHDHKLDAVGQSDYYSLAGVFMNTRWISRTIDTGDPNESLIDDLAGIKDALQPILAERWLGAGESVAEAVAATSVAVDEKAPKPKEGEAPPLPDSLAALWRWMHQPGDDRPFDAKWAELAERYQTEHRERAAANAENLTLAADFTGPDLPEGWRIDGFGMKHGLAANGAMIVAEEGDAVVAQLVPAGRWSHLWSPRLAGALRSPLYPQDPPPTFSLGYMAGHFAAQSLVVDHAFHSERMKFLRQPAPGWLTQTTGHFPALAGEPDTKPRRVYLELVTKSLNNYFPPRDRFGGVTAKDERDPRSWFGVTRLYEHPKDKGPKDDYARFMTLFDGGAPASPDELAERIAALVMASVERWSRGDSGEDDVRLVNDALAANWLPNSALADPETAALVARYRQTEKRIVPDKVVGSVEDWREAADERIAVRGSYTTLAGAVPRGTIRFLGGPAPLDEPKASGRLEFARGIADERNPLTARVYVNRIWHHLFGAGIVRTVDDFGHLGDTPSHPELLDWLARRFMEDGWSTKAIIRRIVTSSAWRQSGLADPAAVTADPDNRLLHHMPLRRLEAEAIRDAILAVAGRLDPTLYGAPVDPYRAAEDPIKRLLRGPLDGGGRRSIYVKMTMMEPPKFLALFNQPMPKLTVGRRDVTNVPDQALALLNDPFVNAMAAYWGDRVLAEYDGAAEARIDAMFAEAFGRPPSAAESERILAFARQCAELNGGNPEDLLSCPPAWHDVAHAMFNVKEFIYLH